jgi:tellurite resistance protein TerC
MYKLPKIIYGGLKFIMDHVVRHSLKWVLFWFVLAMICCGGIYFFMDADHALQFLGGYLIEYSLSMDNLFVFMTIFMAFNVPVEYQHRCLAYGIAGAIVMRFIFILLGVSIVSSFEWVLYIFGFVLIISGIKMFKGDDNKDKDLTNSRVIKIMKKFIPVTDHFEGHNFFTKIDNKLYATPLFAVLLVIESSDILFAIDSVPAAFSVSTNMFIIYASNIFAILGLRQLYFVLEHLQERFQYVKYGVATILTFTGIKLAALIWHVEIPILLSIGIIFGVLVLSILLSIIFTKNKKSA